jgi:hypothetical protein
VGREISSTGSCLYPTLKVRRRMQTHRPFRHSLGPGALSLFYMDGMLHSLVGCKPPEIITVFWCQLRIECIPTGFESPLALRCRLCRPARSYHACRLMLKFPALRIERPLEIPPTIERLVEGICGWRRLSHIPMG